MFGQTDTSGDPSRVKLSAEERLLQVIQNGGESPFQGRGGPLKGFYQKIWSVLRPGNPTLRKKPIQGLSLIRLNKALGVVVVLGLVLSVINPFFFKPEIGRIHSLVADARVPQGHLDLKPIPVEEFLTPITSRNLFQPKTEEAPLVAAPLPTGDAPGIMENLQLVGIAWGAFPEAMIRDKREGRTHFLKQGEQLKEILVKEILKDRVIVEYGGQTKEIL